jgi:hypothetical protein
MPSRAQSLPTYALLHLNCLFVLVAVEDEHVVASRVLGLQPTHTGSSPPQNSTK